MPTKTSTKPFENAQRLKEFITGRLNTASDGWVLTDVSKEIVKDHEELYDKFLVTVSDEDLRKVWPFDQPSSISEV